MKRSVALLSIAGQDARQVWLNGAIGLGHALLKTTWESAKERHPCSLAKRYLDLLSDGHRFQTESLPLRGIYVREERTPSAGTPKVEPIEPMAAVVKLAANTYMNYLLDRELQSEEFRYLSRLVSRVPVRRDTLYRSRRVIQAQ